MIQTIIDFIQSSEQPSSGRPSRTDRAVVQEKTEQPTQPQCRTPVPSLKSSLALILGHARLSCGLPLGGLVVRREGQADAVDAVPLVRGRRVALALEHVAKVAAAVGAYDLGPCHAEGAVLMPRHGPRDAVEVGRPAAARLELVRGLVQGRLARGAGVDALGRVVLVVLAREGRLGALFSQDAELLWGLGSARDISRRVTAGGY